jgi:ankyrin repeat protein
MSYTQIPFEIRLQIAQNLTDPCDYNAFLQVDRATYGLLSPRFNKRFGFPSAWVPLVKNGQLMYPDVSDDSEWESDDSEYESRFADDEGHTGTYGTIIRNGERRLVPVFWQDVLIRASERGNLRLAKLAVRKGASVNRDAEWYSYRCDSRWPDPLVTAAGNGHVDMVNWLLDMGAEIDEGCLFDRDVVDVTPDEFVEEFEEKYEIRMGCTPLIAASYYAEVETVKCLLERGAKVDVEDFGQHRAIHWAVSMPLEDVGNTKGYMEKYLQIVEMLIAHGASPNTRAGLRLQSPVLICTGSCTPMLELLIRHGADVHVLSEERWMSDGIYDYPALHACIVKNGKTKKQKANLASMQLLLENGLPVNVRDNSGWTALNYAAYRGLRDAVDLLLGWGADPRLKDYEEGKTAAMRARQKGHTELAKYLEEKEKLMQ